MYFLSANNAKDAKSALSFDRVFYIRVICVVRGQITYLHACADKQNIKGNTGRSSARALLINQRDQAFQCLAVVNGDLVAVNTDDALLSQVLSVYL